MTNPKTAFNKANNTDYRDPKFPQLVRQAAAAAANDYDLMEEVEYLAQEINAVEKIITPLRRTMR